jgi:hypothetical protein
MVTIPVVSHRRCPYTCAAGRLRRSPMPASLMGRLPVHRTCLSFVLRSDIRAGIKREFTFAIDS